MMFGSKVDPTDVGVVSPFNFESIPVKIEIDEDGNPLFNVNDVCKVLGYTNPRQAIARHVHPDDVTKRDTIDVLGRRQLTSYFWEPGLYSMLFGSKIEPTDVEVISPFNFEGIPIRKEIDEEGNPLFNVNDVCKVLGYTNPRQAVARHVDPKDVTKRDTLTPGWKAELLQMIEAEYLCS